MEPPLRAMSSDERTRARLPRMAEVVADSLRGKILSGEIDVLIRNTTWTISRDTALGFNFTGVNYFDGQGFMINAKKLPGVNSALQLSGASVCVQAGTTTELNLADYFKVRWVSNTMRKPSLSIGWSSASNNRITSPPCAGACGRASRRRGAGPPGVGHRRRRPVGACR